MSATRSPVNGTLRLAGVRSSGSVASSAATEPVAPTSSARAKRRQELVDDDRIARRMATLAAMQSTWPLVFDIDMPVPLAIGTHERVRDALGISDEATDDALRWWCHHAAYRAALAAGGPRYGLDAEPDGEVSNEHRDHATKPVPAPD
jgi:hypothetical protein